MNRTENTVNIKRRGVVLWLALVGTLLAGCGSGGSAKDASGAEKRTTTEATTTTGDSVAAGMREWATNHSDTASELSDLLSSAADDIGNSDLDGLVSDCTGLGDWADRMDGLESMPDPNAQGKWQGIIDSARRGATACVNGVQNSDVEEIRSATAEINAVSAKLPVLTAIFKKYS